MSPDDEFPPTSNDAKYVCVGEPWLNVQKCKKCNVTDDYAYNANYYDSSSTDDYYYYPYEYEPSDADFRSPVPQSGRPDAGAQGPKGPKVTKRRRKSDKKLKLDGKVENCSWNLDPKGYCPIGWPKKLKKQFCDLSNNQNSFGSTPSKPPAELEVGSTKPEAQSIKPEVSTDKPELSTTKPEVDIEQAGSDSLEEFHLTKILFLSSFLFILLL